MSEDVEQRRVRARELAAEFADLRRRNRVHRIFRRDQQRQHNQSRSSPQTPPVQRTETPFRRHFVMVDAVRKARCDETDTHRA